VEIRFDDGTEQGLVCALALTHISKWTTCLRPGAFSMSLDARSYGMGHEMGRSPEEHLRLLQKGRLPRIAVLREVMQARSYDEAVGVAACVRPLTSHYIILGDGSISQNRGGAIVTMMGNESSTNVLQMPEPDEEDGWFVVQTNVDPWEPAELNKYSSERREHVKAELRRLGPAAPAEALYAVLHNASAFPVGNTEKDDGRVFRSSTILSALMLPAVNASAQTSIAAWRWDLWQSMASMAPASPRELFV